MDQLLDNGSCMTGDCHVQFCEQRLGKFQALTHLAVKLAFLLNQDHAPYHTIDDIMNSDAVRLITNNFVIDGMEFKFRDLVRLKQSSDIEQIRYCNEQMELITEKIIEEKIQFEQQKKELEDAYLLSVHNNNIEKNKLVYNLQDIYESNLLGNYEEQNEL